MRDTLMRRSSRVLFKLLAYRPPAIRVPPQGVVLRDITVVNPGGERLSGRTLIVEGDRIAGISPSKPESPVGNRDDRYAGAFVLPGLIDMHVHVPLPSRDLVGPLFLAHGVTSIRGWRRRAN